MGKSMVSCRFSLKPIHWILKTCFFFLWLCLAELLLLQRTAVLQGMLYHIVSCVMASEMERPVDPTSTQRNSAKFVTKDLDAIPGERSKLVQGSICMLAQPQRTHDIFRNFQRLSRNGHFTFEKFETCFRAAPQHLPKPVSKILSEMCWMPHQSLDGYRRQMQIQCLVASLAMGSVCSRGQCSSSLSNTWCRLDSWLDSGNYSTNRWVCLRIVMDLLKEPPENKKYSL